ncbi:Snf2 family protein, partial [mine drainage metagenome]
GALLIPMAADTVIHYDPWWNPAVENQATDRAHRIGQENPVFVYKLLTEGTLEEKILALQERKKELAQGILAGAGESGVPMTGTELTQLFEQMG